MRDAPLSPGDVLGMAGLVAFTASAVFLWSVAGADASETIRDVPVDRELWPAIVAGLLICFGIGMLTLMGVWIAKAFAGAVTGGDLEVDDVPDYRDAESRGGRDV